MDIRIGRFFQWVEIRGQPFLDGKREVFPVARSLSLLFGRGGFATGRFVWTRPVAVEVIEGQQKRRITIPDYGMLIALGIAVAVALPALSRIVGKPWGRHNRQ